MLVSLSFCSYFVNDEIERRDTVHSRMNYANHMEFLYILCLQSHWWLVSIFFLYQHWRNTAQLIMLAPLTPQPPTPTLRWLICCCRKATNTATLLSASTFSHDYKWLINKQRSTLRQNRAFFHWETWQTCCLIHVEVIFKENKNNKLA